MSTQAEKKQSPGGSDEDYRGITVVKARSHTLQEIARDVLGPHGTLLHDKDSYDAVMLFPDGTILHLIHDPDYQGSVSLRPWLGKHRVERTSEWYEMRVVRGLYHGATVRQLRALLPAAKALACFTPWTIPKPKNTKIDLHTAALLGAVQRLRPDQWKSETSYYESLAQCTLSDSLHLSMDFRTSSSDLYLEAATPLNLLSRLI